MHSDIKKESTKKYDTAVILDTGSIDRVNSAYLLDTVSKKLVIDHHMTNTMYGDVNLVEDYPACCEIIYNLIKERAVRDKCSISDIVNKSLMDYLNNYL